MIKLFGTAGIRGPYPGKVNVDLALRLGAALAVYSRGNVCVGFDVRVTSPLLAYGVCVGAMMAGVNAFNIGLAPTPVVAFSTVRLRCGGGVSVTASHNPPTDNGFKVFDSRGMESTRAMEDELERIMSEIDLKKGIASWDKVGEIIHRFDLVNKYVEELSCRLEPRVRRFKPLVVVDCANGAASNDTPRVLRDLGARVVSLNCNYDGFFTGRYPEPRPDVLVDTLNMAKAIGCDVVFAHDGDADRLAVLHPETGFITQDRLIAFYAKLKLMERKGTVIVSIDVGRSVEYIVERYGGRLVRWKLGKTHEKILELGASNILLAAEPWKLIDPEWGLWVDAIYQAALIAKTMIEEGKDIRDLLADIPLIPQRRLSIKVPEEHKIRLFNTVRDEMTYVFKDYEKIFDFDGLRLNLSDCSWILIRPSGTEPKIRIYAEAPTNRELEEIVNKAIKLVKECSSKLGVKIEHIES